MKLLFPWLKDCPSQALQQSLKDLDQSFKNFFKGNAKYPKFKRKGELPKLGWMKFRKTREIKGEIKNATVSKTGRHWFISFCCVVELEQKSHPSRKGIEIDMGIAKFATLSDGRSYEGTHAHKKHLDQLKRQQRSLSRKQKGSSNWKKDGEKLCNIHIKIGNARRDYLHKASTEISKNHAMVFVEELKVGNMSRSAKGDSSAPGKNVKAKSGLNRSILDQGWSEFLRQLDYKLTLTWEGGELHRIDPKYTSQKCSSCGIIEKRNRKSQSRYDCQACGYAENTDVNAAKNILAVGHTALACGDIGPVTP